MDLREILREHGVTYTDGHVENAMKEAIRQALESSFIKTDSFLRGSKSKEYGKKFNENALYLEIMSIMDEL